MVLRAFINYWNILFQFFTFTHSKEKISNIDPWGERYFVEYPLFWSNWKAKQKNFSFVPDLPISWEYFCNRKYFGTIISINVPFLLQDAKLAVGAKLESPERLKKSSPELSRISPAPHVIGSLPIAEYEGSPRRYGLRTSESIMPTLLSSPTVSFSRPGFPQVCPV